MSSEEAEAEADADAEKGREEVSNLQEMKMEILTKIVIQMVHYKI